MGTPEDIVTIEEAARILGVCHRMVHKLVRDRLLHPVPLPGPNKLKKYFRLADVAAYAETQTKKISLADVATMADRAYAVSCGNEKRITNLMRVLGLDSKVLETTEEAVVSLVLRMEDTTLSPPVPKAKDVMEWARTFLAVNEGYLNLVASYTASEEPWAPFMHLAQVLSEGMPTDALVADKELEEAYGYLEAGRRNLRHVGYFYIRERHGSKKADMLFPVEEDYATPVMTMLYAH